MRPLLECQGTHLHDPRPQPGLWMPLSLEIWSTKTFLLLLECFTQQLLLILLPSLSIYQLPVYEKRHCPSLAFQHMVTLCVPGWPWTSCSLSSDRITGVCHPPPKVSQYPVVLSWRLDWNISLLGSEDVTQMIFIQVTRMEEV